MFEFGDAMENETRLAVPMSQLQRRVGLLRANHIRSESDPCLGHSIHEHTSKSNTLVLELI